MRFHKAAREDPHFSPIIFDTIQCLAFVVLGLSIAGSSFEKQILLSLCIELIGRRGETWLNLKTLLVLLTIFEVQCSTKPRLGRDN